MSIWGRVFPSPGKQLRKGDVNGLGNTTMVGNRWLLHLGGHSPPKKINKQTITANEALIFDYVRNKYLQDAI